MTWAAVCFLTLISQAVVVEEECFTEPDYNYPHYDLGAPIRQANWKACRDSAMGAGNAHYWTFRFSDRLCWLKSSNRDRKAEGRGILISGNAGCKEGFKPRQQSIMELGYPNCGAGWFDVQKQGVNNDYCRWVGKCGCRGSCSFWSCALAGSDDQYTPKGQYLEHEHAEYHYVWKGRKNIFADQQCPNIGNNPGLRISGCMKKCHDTPTCSAINVRIDGVRLDCVLRACPFPVPNPNWKMSGYKSYYKKVIVMTTTTMATTTTTANATTKATTTDSSVVLIAGGNYRYQYSKRESNGNTVEVFDPIGLCDANLAKLPIKRFGHSAHYLNKTGEILLCGGWSVPADRSCSVLVGDTFQHHSNLVEPGRFHHSEVVISDKLWIIGGFGGRFSAYTSTSMESLSSPGTVWSEETAQLKQGRWDGCAVGIPTNDIILIGGLDDDGQLIEYEQVTKFNTITKIWTALTPMLSDEGRRHGHSCVHITSAEEGNGQVLVAGGYDVSNYPVSTAQIYDIDNDKWIMARDMNIGRGYGEMLVVDGRVLFLGGVGRYGRLGSIEEYHSGNDTWTILDQTLKRAREKFSATVIPRSAIGC